MATAWSNQTDNNRVSYFIDGKAIFPEILRVIDGAKKSVYVETFLLYDDEAGNAIADKMAEKAEAGLDVRLLVSEKGTEFSKAIGIFDKLRRSKVKIGITFPFDKRLQALLKTSEWTKEDGAGGLRFRAEEPRHENILRMGDKYLARMHRKLDLGKRLEQSFLDRLFPRLRKIFRSVQFYDHRKIVAVDNAQAVLGGMNLGNDYLFQGPPSELGYFHDIGIAIEGEAVGDVTRLYLEVWNLFNREKATLPPAPEQGSTAHEEGLEITTLTSYPHFSPNRIREAYIDAIRQAQSSIYIINLFVSHPTIIGELIAAKRRGVDIHIISTFLPTVSMKGLFTKVLYRGYYYLVYYKHELKNHGIGLHHYTRYNVHAKVAIVDDKWLTIGSSNLDQSSLRNAMEINVGICDGPFINRLRNDLFAVDLKTTAVLERDLPLTKRLAYYGCYLIYSFGDRNFL